MWNEFTKKWVHENSGLRWLNLASRRQGRQPSVKERHELGFTLMFVAYLESIGIRLTDLRPGDQRHEPDAVALVGGELRGIEIVDTWYSGADAKSVYGLVRDLEQRGIRRREPGAGFEERDFDHPSGDPFVSILQRHLNDHGLKHYAMPSWLVLNASGVIAPLHTSANGPRLIQDLMRPARFGYLDAYLCLSESPGGPRFFRVP